MDEFKEIKAKAKFTEHRFSIRHKRIMAENEKPFEEKKEMKVRKDRKRKAIEEDPSVVTFQNLEHEFTKKIKWNCYIKL